ncbi:MAG: TetR/AcrR family transcriptional regulator, partial [Halioglobus sp.]
MSEDLFARHGYDGTSLRQIADGAGIKEPGLYNHFAGKQALYEAVLFRALNPMAEALAKHMATADHLRDYTELPSVMTDLLLAHPQMAALFQQAMQGDKESLSNQLVGHWLDTLLQQGMNSLIDIGAPEPDNSTANANDAHQTLAINLIAMFNLTTGYFLSQRAFDTLS